MCIQVARVYVCVCVPGQRHGHLTPGCCKTFVVCFLWTPGPVLEGPGVRIPSHDSGGAGGFSRTHVRILLLHVPLRKRPIPAIPHEKVSSFGHHKSTDLSSKFSFRHEKTLCFFLGPFFVQNLQIQRKRRQNRSKEDEEFGRGTTILF